MATNQMGEVIQHIRTAALLQDLVGLTDGQLLNDFLNYRDESALAALVLRHVPMVWGVCSRILRNDHDAEDAFQATFLVLVRKAESIASRELLANWLYGVANQTALKARATVARRRTREKQVPEMPEPEAAPQGRSHNLESLLDQELSRLPNKYRIPLVLCDLEGKTRKEAARELGCPEGTVAGRLARAREMLAKRLTRHGVVLPASLAAALLPTTLSHAACVPTGLVSRTINATSLCEAGQAAVGGVISSEVIALTDGVLKSRLLTRLKSAAAVLLAAVVLGTGLAAAGLPFTTPSAQGTPAWPKEKDAKKALDALQGTWRIIKLDIDHEETREQFEKLGKLVVKGNKATLLLDLAGQGFEKKEIMWAEFTILKAGSGKPPTIIDLRLDKTIEIQGLKPKIAVTLPGIYRLEGKTLKLFFGEETRPKGFPEKKKQGLVTLERIKRQKGKDDKPAEKPKPKE